MKQEKSLNTSPYSKARTNQVSNRAIQKLIQTLCRPNANIPKILKNTSFHTLLLSDTSIMKKILNDLGNRKKKKVALSVWKWMKDAAMERNVEYYNAMISGKLERTFFLSTR